MWFNALMCHKVWNYEKKKYGEVKNDCNAMVLITFLNLEKTNENFKLAAKITQARQGALNKRCLNALV